MLLRQRGTCATVWWSEYNFRTCGACAVTCNMISNWGSFVTPFNLCLSACVLQLVVVTPAVTVHFGKLFLHQQGCK